MTIYITISTSYVAFFVAVEGFLLRYLYPLLCLCLIVGSHADCALSGPFSEQRKKGKENQQDAIFLNKFTFFFNPYIGISGKSIKSDEQKKEYSFLDPIEVLNNLILLDYRKNPDIFSREARKIISSARTEKEELKWEDPDYEVNSLRSAGEGSPALKLGGNKK